MASRSFRTSANRDREQTRERTAKVQTFHRAHRHRAGSTQAILHFFLAAFFFATFFTDFFLADFFLADFGADFFLPPSDFCSPPKTRSQFSQYSGVVPVRTIGPPIIRSTPVVFVVPRRTLGQAISRGVSQVGRISRVAGSGAQASKATPDGKAVLYARVNPGADEFQPMKGS